MERAQLPLYLTTPKWSCDPMSLFVCYPFPSSPSLPNCSITQICCYYASLSLQGTVLWPEFPSFRFPCHRIQRTHPVFILLDLSNICYSWKTFLSQYPLHLLFCFHFCAFVFMLTALLLFLFLTFDILWDSILGISLHFSLYSILK